MKEKKIKTGTILRNFPVFAKAAKTIEPLLFKCNMVLEGDLCEPQTKHIIYNYHRVYSRSDNTGDRYAMDRRSCKA